MLPYGGEGLPAQLTLPNQTFSLPYLQALSSLGTKNIFFSKFYPNLDFEKFLLFMKFSGIQCSPLMQSLYLSAPAAQQQQQQQQQAQQLQQHQAQQLQQQQQTQQLQQQALLEQLLADPRFFQQPPGSSLHLPLSSSILSSIPGIFFWIFRPLKETQE
jgi:hypothetical protein